MESSTYVYLPKITCGNIAVIIIAFESLTFWWKQPMIFGPDENHLTIQPLFIVLSAVTPFVCERIGRVTPPLFADLWHSWVIIFHPHKRATGIRSRIRLTAKVLDNSFTSTVSGRGHVERTSLLFTTEESQLSKGHIRPEFFHGASVENNVFFLVEANFIVGPLEGGLNRWGALNDVGNEKPPTWKPKRYCLLSCWFYSIIHLFLYFYLIFCIFCF